jgi:hypothetical protein
MNLEACLEATVDYANALIEVAIAQKSLPLLGKVYNDIASHYRAMGIYDLLINADTDGFFYGLVQSGLTRKCFLQRCQDNKELEIPERMASFADPFFDAIAANQVRLAAQIAEASPGQWFKGLEYEDDFAYAAFLYSLILNREAKALEAYLLELQGAIEENVSERLDVCRALLERSQDSFDDAFSRFLDLYFQQQEELANPKLGLPQAQEFTFEANRRICVEGLAILRIAELRGLRTEGEYILCPDIARKADYKFVSHSFPNLPLES